MKEMPEKYNIAYPYDNPAFDELPDIKGDQSEE